MFARKWVQGREQWIRHMVLSDALDGLCELARVGLLALKGVHCWHVWLLRIDLGIFVFEPYALHEEKARI
jgi:hypothetical protein